MGQDERSPASAQDWLAVAAAAEQAGREAGASGALSDAAWRAKSAVIADARQVLELLAQERMAIGTRFWRPPEVPPMRPPPDGLAKDAEMARQLRDSVLRLGVWDALGRWHRAALAADHDATLLGLIRAIGRCRGDALIEAAGNFIESGRADAFFDERLAPAVRLLATLFDDHGTRLHAALDEASRAPRAQVQRSALWSRLWTRTACITYADYLYRLQRRDPRIDGVRHALWPRATMQIRPPTGEVVLPTDDKHLQLVLAVPMISAQLLQHDPVRWRRGDRRYALKFSFRELQGGDAGDDVRGRIPFHTGITVGMLYQAVFIEGVGQAVESLRGRP